MIARIEKLTPRERLMLGGLAAALALLLLVYGLILPINGFKARALSDFDRAGRLAVLTDGLEAPDTAATDNRGLRAVVTDKASAQGVVFERLQATPDGGLQMDLTSVPYAAFFTWLNDLRSSAGIVVTEAYVTSGDEQATIDARLTLMRSD
ncbi:MAG: type II secretion system protein GspM [Pseudomonadota bacterium]